jgi:1-deoxyxylulose-5-phosphate synthase
MEAVEASLKRLNTDDIDLYQMHFPDPQTPILETLGALDDLVRQGKIRYVGHSNFSAWQIADAQWTARTEHIALPVCAQNQYHLLRQEVRGDVLSACRAFGVELARKLAEAIWWMLTRNQVFNPAGPSTALVA